MGRRDDPVPLFPLSFTGWVIVLISLLLLAGLLYVRSAFRSAVDDARQQHAPPPRPSHPAHEHD